MRTDPGRELQEAVIATMDAGAREAERTRLMGPMTELERAEFLLRRLHPTLPEASLQQILSQLAEAEVAGTWHGFRRPEPLPVR